MMIFPAVDEPQVKIIPIWFVMIFPAVDEPQLEINTPYLTSDEVHTFYNFVEDQRFKI